MLLAVVVSVEPELGVRSLPRGNPYAASDGCGQDEALVIVGVFTNDVDPAWGASNVDAFPDPVNLLEYAQNLRLVGH